MNNNIKKIAEALQCAYPDRTDFTRAEILNMAETLGIGYAERNKILKQLPKIKKGVYDFAGIVLQMKPQGDNQVVESTIDTQVIEDCYVPATDDTYIRWGHFKDVSQIISAGIFYPTFVTGLSGNGKTMMIEQACAKLNRAFVRVQVTPETDEDDLIGGFRLVDGKTVFFKGPVVHAMEQGAILLIDEIDRGSNKIMALQGVLEGKPVLLKKTGEVVHPKPGFNVIATANTKGRGSDDGRFTAATIIDDAFLERFAITMEQPFPPAKTEKRIVANHMKKFGAEDDEFVDRLVTWADVIRKTFDEEAVDEVISTRRLCHITQTFSIFTDRMKAIELCIARFDEDTKLAFLDLYTKVDRDVDPITEDEPTNENDWEPSF